MNNKRKTPVILYIISGFSFMPMIGVFVGIAVILFGVLSKYKDRILVIVGICGILFTVIICFLLFYFGSKHRGSVFDDLRKQMAEGQLTSIVKELEYYKIQKGKYPDSLKHIYETKGVYTSIYDPVLLEVDKKTKTPFFYYKLEDTGYYLFSVGYDTIPFTEDDILPKIPCEETEKIGILRCIIDSSNTE